MNQVVEAVSRPVVAQSAVVITPIQLLQVAYEKGASIEQLERLMVLKREFEADEARKAFNVAFAEFKAEAIKLVRTKQITDGPLKGKKHADLAVIVETVTPALSRHGLSAAWRLTKDDKDWMEVTCTLSHAAGHSESVAMGGAPDTGPGRNAMQARGSAKSYLERYTLTAITGLAAGDADDDGTGGNGGNSNSVEFWAGKAALAATLDDLGKVSKDGAREFRGASCVAEFKLFASAVIARGAALRAAGATQ
jgi:hypothetical protein